jgi:fluoroacetyl-CoA thioesterase
MKPTLQAGLKATHTYTIAPNKRVPDLYPEAADFQAMPGVFATGFMVGLMEWACLEVIKDHLDDGEGSLGIDINVDHSAASLPGQTVTVEAECTAVEGRRVTFKVVAHDGVDRIGQGTHRRMIVRWHRFKAMVNAKAEKAGVPGLGES